jgi:hypothetical protein
MEVVPLARALRDLLTIAERFEDAHPGLGTKFDAAVQQAFTQIANFPDSAPVWRPSGFRRLVIRRFSTGVFYAIHGIEYSFRDSWICANPPKRFCATFWNDQTGLPTHKNNITLAP